MTTKNECRKSSSSEFLKGDCKGLLAGLLIAVAQVSAVGFFIPLLREAGLEGQALTDQVFALLALLVVITALVGAILRAYAHGHESRKDCDYAGKVFALAATIGISFSATYALVEPLQALVINIAFFVLAALPLVWLVFFIIGRARRSRG